MQETDELARLRRQVADAQAALDDLTDRRQAALDGCGLSPRQSDLDRARARVEAAEGLLQAHQRMEATS